jgi:hypothetical protein
MSAGVREGSSGRHALIVIVVSIAIMTALLFLAPQ